MLDAYRTEQMHFFAYENEYTKDYCRNNVTLNDPLLLDYSSKFSKLEHDFLLNIRNKLVNKLNLSKTKTNDEE